MIGMLLIGFVLVEKFSARNLSFVDVPEGGEASEAVRKDRESNALLSPNEASAVVRTQPETGDREGDDYVNADHEDRRIVGRVSSERGEGVQNVSLKLLFSDREHELVAQTDEDGHYSFALNQPEHFANRSPVSLHASAEGFLRGSFTLWRDKVGYRFTALERRIDIVLEDAQDKELLWLFDDGSPVAHATIELEPLLRHRWSTKDEASMRVREETDSEGRMQVRGLPLAGAWLATVGLKDLPGWILEPIELGGSGANRHVIPKPCTLRVQLADDCFDPEGLECSRTHVQVLVDGGVDGGGHDPSGYYRVEDGRCTINGLTKGQTVKLRVTCSAGLLHVLTADLQIITHDQELSFSCNGAEPERESVLPTEGHRNPTLFQWELIDIAGRPLRFSSLDGLNISNFHGNWSKDGLSGTFSLVREDYSPNAQARGFVELPVLMPVAVEIHGLGQNARKVIERKLDSVSLVIPPDSLPEKIGTVEFLGVDGASVPVPIATLSLAELHSGLEYNAFGSGRRGAEPLDLFLPQGVYDFEMVSVNQERAYGRFEVASSTGQLSVTAEFGGDGSLVGFVGASVSVGTISLVRVDARGGGMSTAYTARLRADGKCTFSRVAAGEYSVFYTAQKSGHRNFYLAPGRVRVNPGRITQFSGSVADTESMVQLAVECPDGESMQVELRRDKEIRFRGLLNRDDLLFLHEATEVRVLASRDLGGWRSPQQLSLTNPTAGKIVAHPQ